MTTTGRISKGCYIGRIIRHEFPGVESTLGIGWCGPGWRQAEIREKELNALLPEPLPTWSA